MAPMPMETSEISNHISGSGYCTVPNFIDSLTVKALSDDLDQLLDQGNFKKATIGQGQERQALDVIRRDQICWIDSVPATPLRQELLKKMEILKQNLNENLFLGLFQFEMLYSIYEPGAFYKRHRDVFKKDDSRRISTVLYLNENWDNRDGGELVLYAGPSPVTIPPTGGTLVCFLSDIEHEVKEAFKLRKSCAGWFSKNKGANFFAPQNKLSE